MFTNQDLKKLIIPLFLEQLLAVSYTHLTPADD